jgi:hypothetical protein
MARDMCMQLPELIFTYIARSISMVAKWPAQQNASHLMPSLLEVSSHTHPLTSMLCSQRDIQESFRRLSLNGVLHSLGLADSGKPRAIYRDHPCELGIRPRHWSLSATLTQLISQRPTLD